MEDIVDAVLKELGMETGYQSSDESSCGDDNIVSISSYGSDVEDRDPDEESMTITVAAREGVSRRTTYRGKGEGKARQSKSRVGR